MSFFSKHLFLPTCLLFLAATFSANAQLGFCGGNSGDPIFTETFGIGATNGPELPMGTTTYDFTTATPDDGDYTISSNTNYFDWHSTNDHTPNDTNGKMLIVNASFTAGEFYQRTITGLCENTTYEFSAWLLNLSPTNNFCTNNGNTTIPINVRFQIRDETDAITLGIGDTGSQFPTQSPTWTQHGLVFKTLPGQTSVILKMINNGNGGCGNDLAIDDIVFKSCGDNITVSNTAGENSITQCENLGPVSTTLTATPDFSIFTSHAYQWQRRTDATSWVDILGANADTYTTPLLTENTFYRVKLAEDAINLSNSFCVVLSETFEVIIVPVPEAPIGNEDITLCANDLQPLEVTVPNGVLVNWYDALTGGDLLLANSTTYATQIPGTYYAEAIGPSPEGCVSVDRTAISLSIDNVPTVTNENLIFCEGETVLLTAETAASYEWSTGETTQTINATQAGIYTVTVTNTVGCSAIKTFALVQIDQPEIDTIVSDFRNIIVNLVSQGDYEYSLNDGVYQNSPILGPVRGGLYTINVRGKNNCEVVSTSFLHFVIPNFFTPNGDGNNDTFSPEGLEFVDTYKISIFDRYGRLLQHSTNSGFSWDGTINSVALPASDYWYLIQTDVTVYRGHFALKR